MDLIELKKLAKNEKWEKIDRVIPRVCKQPIYINWAIVEGLKDKNPNIRDLAASLLEKATIPESEFIAIASDLKIVMDKDYKLYSGFRAACALAAHSPLQYPNDVERVLARFEKDPDVTGIAKSYLKKIKR